MVVRGLVFTHLTNTKKKKAERWGNAWQSAYWASQCGEAAWMLWDKLTPSTRQGVANMIEFEANRFNNYRVPYYADKNGKIRHVGDTKGEENAWNSRILMLAVNAMPTHPHNAAWKTKACALMVSAWSRPSDLNCEESVDGKPVKDWLNGWNTYENGLVMNHRFIHPDYNCGYLCYAAAIDCALTNSTIPKSAFWNDGVMYHYYAAYSFKPGPSEWGDIREPGGTIYRRSENGGYLPDNFYPQGTDWSYHWYDCYLEMDIYAKLRNLDAGKDYDALGWANARVEAMRAKQDPQGRIYTDKDFMGMRCPDADAFQALAESWMVWWLTQHKLVPPVATN
jgi:hypothetical protein